MESKALMTMDKRTMMERIESARFPQALTEPEKKLLAMVAISYGFDPLMGEITIYQGKPYVSIDGRYRKAQETGLLNGVHTRPATKQEREEWQIPDGDFFILATVEVKGGGKFEGWGRVRKAEMVGGKGYKPVETNPQNQASVRAEHRALRKAFHIPLPSFEERGTGQDDTDIPLVNPETGEIIPEGEKPKANHKQAEKDIKDFYPPVQQPVVSKEVTEQKKAGNTEQTPIPSTKQAFLTWIFTHKVKATVDQVAGWIINPSTNQPHKKMEELPDTPEAIKSAYGEIKNMQGWEN